jgi:Tfp pilus assembly protein PilE
MGNRDKGITLIELIVFILVGGIFIPLAYIAFTSALRESTTPDAYVKARFIAEAKMEDITRERFVNLPVSSSTYANVNTDSRYSDSSYNNYQWKWILSDIAYLDSGTQQHGTTVIAAPSIWDAVSYKVGDYVLWGTQYYRADFSTWASVQPYFTGDYVVSSTAPTPNSIVYRCTADGTSGVSEPTWPGTGSTVTDGSVTWMATSITPTIILSSTKVPTVLNETGKIRWIASNPYKQITVYVKRPQCADDTCAYKVSTIVTSRTAP